MVDKIFKRVHKDGSETVIKQVNPAFRDSKGAYRERESQVTSIFISSSYGCPYSCLFCHLTENKTPFKDISAEDIVLNVLEAVWTWILEGNSAESFKLCFMGMGDPTIDAQKTAKIISNLSSYLKIDEIDISSVKYNKKDVEVFESIRENNNIDVRLFLSAHTFIKDARKNIIGSCYPVENSVKNLVEGFHGYDGLKIHYTPVEGLNSTPEHAESIVSALLKSDNYIRWQVRMLEFNPAEGSEYKRPPIHVLTSLYEIFTTSGIDVKWQVSKGYSEKAACGQFQKELV